MKQKQSMVALVDYKYNYDTATMTANCFEEFGAHTQINLQIISGLYKS